VDAACAAFLLGVETEALPANPTPQTAPGFPGRARGEERRWGVSMGWRGRQGR